MPEDEGPGSPTDADEPGVPPSHRRRRRSRPRSVTFAIKRIRRDLRAEALTHQTELPRPLTRGECREEERPCPWVACKHHLYLDINPETGSIKINFPDVEPWDLRQTCALDVAESGVQTLEEVGSFLNLTRERVRQIEVQGLLKLKIIHAEADQADERRIAQEDR